MRGRVLAVLCCALLFLSLCQAQAETEPMTTDALPDATTVDATTLAPSTTLEATTGGATTVVGESTLPPGTTGEATTLPPGTTANEGTTEGLTTIGVVVVNSTTPVNETTSGSTTSAATTTPIAATPVPTAFVPTTPLVVFSAKLSVSIRISVHSFRDDDFASRVAAVVGVSVRQVVILSRRQQGDETVVEFCFASTTFVDAKLRVDKFRDIAAKNETVLIEDRPTQVVKVDHSDAGSFTSTRIRIRVRVSVRGFDDFDFAALVASTVGLSTDCVQILSKFEVDGTTTVEFRFTTTSVEVSEAKCRDFVAAAPTNNTFGAVYPIDFVNITSNGTTTNATAAPVTAAPAVPSAPLVTFSSTISVSVSISITAFSDSDFKSRVATIVGVTVRQIVIVGKRSEGNGNVTVVEFCIAAKTQIEGKLNIDKFRGGAAKNESLIEDRPGQVVKVDRSDAGEAVSARIRIRVRVSVRGFDDFDFAALVASTVGLSTDCVQILSKAQIESTTTIEFRFTTTSRSVSDSKCNDFVASAPKNSTFTTAYPIEAVSIADTQAVTAPPAISTPTSGASAIGGTFATIGAIAAVFLLAHY